MPAAAVPSLLLLRPGAQDDQAYLNAHPFTHEFIYAFDARRAIISGSLRHSRASRLAQRSLPTPHCARRGLQTYTRLHMLQVTHMCVMSHRTSRSPRTPRGVPPTDRTRHATSTSPTRLARTRPPSSPPRRVTACWCATWTVPPMLPLYVALTLLSHLLRATRR